MLTRKALTLCALTSLVCAGCASVRTSNTARTAREQLLISGSVDRALNKVNFEPMAGASVYLEEKYLDSIDRKYVLGSVRHRLLRERARLVSTPAEADVIVEVRSGGIGTDNAETFIGSPEITLPGMLTLPEVRMATRSSQKAYAKIGLVAFDAKTGEVLGDGGVTSALSDDNNWFIAGIGPIQTGALKKEIRQSHHRQRTTPHAPLPALVAFESPAPAATDSPGSDFEFASGTNAFEE